MLGAFRLVLALLVVVYHLAEHPLAHHTGMYAVNGFYVVSGFLMTMVLNEVYAGRPIAFWTNRLLRLLPPYYIVAAATAAVVLRWPHAAGAYHNSWLLTEARPFDLTGQLLIFPFALSSTDTQFRLVPPIWSVGVEIVNYLLLWIFMARSPLLAISAFAFGAAYHVFYLVMDPDFWPARYAPWYAAIVPFSVGALTYFAFADGGLTNWRHAAAALGLWTVNLVAAGLAGPGAFAYRVGWYLNIVLAAYVIAALGPRSAANWLGRVDKTMGDMAYPIFLVHWIISFAIVLIVPTMRQYPILLCVTTTPLTALYGWLIARMAERLIEPLRHRVRVRDHIGGFASAQTKPTH
jgi:peptidoglycan/LPS O-acetylase OafA/YrhL